MQGRDTLVTAQPRVVKRARATMAVRGWAARSLVTFMRLVRKTHEPGGLREDRRNPTLWTFTRDFRGEGHGGDAAAAGREGEIRRRNVVMFFLFGRCGRARQAVVPQDCRASLDRSRNDHRGGFSRLESGTTTPLPPVAAWCPCGFPPR